MNIVSQTASSRSGASSEYVVTRLNEMMRRGEILSDGRLPSVHALAKVLGVSRPALAVHLRSLTAAGILRSRRGSGTFVVAADQYPFLDDATLRLLAVLHGFTAEEIFEARLALELHIVSLAAERASSEELTQMAEQVAEMYASVNDPKEFLSHELRFHQMIAQAAGNRILTTLMNMMTQTHFMGRNHSPFRDADLVESANMHRKLYAAIRDGSAREAASTMRTYVVTVRKIQRIKQRKLLR